MHLDGQNAVAERRADPDVGDGPIRGVAEISPARIDARRDQERLVRPEIGGRKAQGPPAPYPWANLTRNGVVPPEEAGSSSDVSLSQGRPHRGRRHRDTIDVEGRDDR